MLFSFSPFISRLLACSILISMSLAIGERPVSALNLWLSSEGLIRMWRAISAKPMDSEKFLRKYCSTRNPKLCRGSDDETK